MFAIQALGLADLFQITFAAPIGSSVPYKAELAAPEGASTGGGKQAVQPVTLVPVKGGMTLMVGSANPVDQTAEIRTYDYLARMQVMRSKKLDLPLERVAYDDFVKRLQTFFAERGLMVQLVSEPPGDVAEASPPTAARPSVTDRPRFPVVTRALAPRSNKIFILGGVLAAVVAAAVAYQLYR